MKNNKVNIIIASTLILMVGILRIINSEMHLYNFAPVCALGLFSGAIIKDKRYVFILPLLAQFFGDLYFHFFTHIDGFYGISQLFVYIGLFSVALLGTQMRNTKALNVLGYTFAGSTLFFILSNLGIWLSIEFGKIDLYHYGKGMIGLYNTFYMAIPFFNNSIIGDFAGSIVLFGTYYLLQLWFYNKLQKAKI